MRYLGKQTDLIDFIKADKKKRKIMDSKKRRTRTGTIVEIDGIKYISISEASRRLKINRTTLIYRLKAKTFKKYKILQEKKI